MEDGHGRSSLDGWYVCVLCGLVEMSKFRLYSFTGNCGSSYCYRCTSNMCLNSFKFKSIYDTTVSLDTSHLKKTRVQANAQPRNWHLRVAAVVDDPCIVFEGNAKLFFKLN